MISTRSLLRLGALLSFGVVAQAGYTIQDNYDSNTFFEGFEFFSGSDPTNGFVKYHDASTANSTSLAGYAEEGIFLGVDYTTMKPQAPGRGSVRVTSKKAYTTGLFIADIAHMPGGCGIWPAFWTFGPNWPNSGEIDIIEGVNSYTNSTSTLHTSEGCTFSQGDCGAGQGTTGCGQQSNNVKTYGSGFNAIGGGVWALEWTNQAISIWFFDRTSIPSDITAGTPKPTSWGTAQTAFSGSGCNIDQHFQNHNIVFNTDFCGDWAGKVWASDGNCKSLAATCNDYVSSNPSAFTNAYWLINSVKVYSANGNTTTSKRDHTVSRPFVA